ncbi:hypothetical protein FHY55_17805 [Oceanicola sp. D3]|uniref:hypothetical protein n=1 Tax=Oceanicola sp. D3 TaxID=2587163 RepID=UPI001123CDEE|nr:hypothetical protein [Oceanicola sp. D3]QDC10973.1 hypothetical protein FHY55_17805 [Oceanicola sp. D3]
MKEKLSNLPLATKALLATPAAVLLVLLILTTPAIGVPLAVILLLVFRPKLLSPRWWREFLRQGP